MIYSLQSNLVNIHEKQGDDMKLDYQLIELILMKVEKEGDGFKSVRINSKDCKSEEEFIALAYHYKLLSENGLIDGKVDELPYKGNSVPIEIRFKDLTLLGHQALEAMKNNTIWGKIKSKVQELGVEGLKQIPALAIKLFLGA